MEGSGGGGGLGSGLGVEEGLSRLEEGGQRRGGIVNEEAVKRGCQQRDGNGGK